MKKLLPLFFLLISLGVLVSCSSGPGYAVVLWSDDPGLAAADLVSIQSVSQQQGTTIVMKGEQLLEVESFRLEVFQEESSAQDFQQDYLSRANLFVICENQGLPLRDAPDTSGQRIYKISEGQQLKVIQRMEGPVQIGNLEGYWYELLTEDGYRGFAFDYYLVLFDEDRGFLEERNDGLEDQLAFLFERWRPRDFQIMINNGFIDLDRFQESFGFQILSEEKTFILGLPAHNITQEFTSIDPLGANQYLLTGSTMRIRIINEERISLSYQFGGEDHLVEMVILEENVSEIIEEERNRRRDVFAQMFRRGNLLASPSYGEITLEENGRFTWDNYQRLVPQVLEPEWGNSGFISFEKGLSSALQSQFQGVITFNFFSDERTIPVFFLYNLQSEGLQLIPADPESIEDNVVGPQSQIFLTLFFRFSSLEG